MGMMKDLFLNVTTVKKNTKFKKQSLETNISI